MKALLILILSCIPSSSWAQKLPHDFTCQELLDVDSGNLSRTTDGGKTYVPIRRPQPKDPFSKALLSYGSGEGQFHNRPKAVAKSTRSFAKPRSSVMRSS